MYETQLYLSYTQQRVLHVLEHCKFLFSELEKKNCKRAGRTHYSRENPVSVPHPT